jgi:molybdate transport system substrate-binding protein
MIRILLACLLFVGLHGQPAGAQTLSVITAGALKPLVVAMAPGFEARTGVKLQVSNDTAGAIVRRLQGGEAFDLAIVTSAGIDTLSASGKTDPGSARPIGKVGIGVAVKTGAALPALASVDDFKRAVVAARRIAYIDPGAGGSSGIYMKDLFGRLGLADVVQAKAVLVPGGLTAARLVSGEVDLAIQQASELMVVEGATLAGMLPEEIQNYTVYAGGIASTSRQKDAAAAFMAELVGPAAQGMMRQGGIQPAR